MDEYLEEETECIKQALDSICKKWDHQVSFPPSHCQVQRLTI